LYEIIIICSTHNIYIENTMKKTVVRTWQDFSNNLRVCYISRKSSRGLFEDPRTFATVSHYGHISRVCVYLYSRVSSARASKWPSMNRSFKRTRCVPRCACIDYSTPAKPSAFHQASGEKETLAFTRHWVGLWHHATGNVLRCWHHYREAPEIVSHATKTNLRISSRYISYQRHLSL